ncbi:MAG: ATP-binding protein, partial [Draconibacterium sp.]
YSNGAAGKAIYSNLRPGTYQFRLKGTNSHGVWNENETVLDICIKPPLWASLPLIVVYSILIILIAWGIVYYYTIRLKMVGELNLIRMEKGYTDNLAKARQQFLTNIAHEFKTPLSLIIGPAEKLMKNKSLDASGKKYVNLIESSTRRLLWLNNQLVDFRLLENKTLKMRISSFDFVGFARNVSSLFTDKAERKNIEFTFHSWIDYLEVDMDLRKVESILFNLLSNAFKFTQKNGKIDVSIQPDKTGTTQKIEMHVSDSGNGISPEDKEKVFDRFYQANSAIKMNRGSGIGLTLVQGYAKMHGGEVTLTSGPGKGTEFKVTLPVEGNYQGSGLIVENQGSETILKTSRKVAAEENDMLLSPISGKSNILLVEDDHEIVDFVKASLKNKYNVDVTTNGIEALQATMVKKPDIVICDIIMPQMGGIEFAKKFKNNPKTSHIPLILLTGQSGPEKQLEGLKSGADAYMTKPFTIEMLEIHIENIIKSRERLASYFKIDKIIEPDKVQIASQDEKVLEKIVASIEKYISAPDMNVEKLCKETGLSHPALYRKIKSMTGYTVKEFIRTVRIRRAEQLLRTQKFTVAEVMYETGFSNHSYFSKCFRKLYKMTPKSYMKQI